MEKEFSWRRLQAQVKTCDEQERGKEGSDMTGTTDPTQMTR